MAKMKAAFIGFQPRGISQDEMFENLKVYREIGYSATEGASFLLNGDVEENKKRLADIGMKALHTHLPKIDASPEVIREAIEGAKKAGVTNVACYMGCVGGFRFGSTEVMPTYDMVMKEIETLNTIAKELGKEGLTLSFHNHDAEFMSYFKGKPAFYHMLDNSEYLKFQLDCGWALYGHFDPVKVLNDVGEKLISIHVKDWKLNNTFNPTNDAEDEKLHVPMPTFVPPGNGELPLERVLCKASSMGIEYAIVEMDFMHNLSRADSLRSGYLNMVETGFVE